ncbi:MAG TPA: hypothetical protein DHV63_15200 [Pseudomonas sp.]|nr:hypothetical protein [Pseudomonas sp.]
MSKMTPLAAALLVAVSGSVLANEHMAEVEQIGTNNSTEQTQSGVMQRSFILQNGTENRALTDQSGTSSEDGQASIEQVGMQNLAEIYQVNGGSPGTATAEIYQAGTANSATLEQQVYLNDLSVTATIHQEGTGNRLNARQSWVGNELNVVSIGQENLVEVIQPGFSILQVQQTGTANELRFEYMTSGFGEGFAAVEQVGTANQADISQYSGRYPGGEIFLNQYGMANVANIESGSYATVDFTQQGTGNELDSSISGLTSLTGRSEGDYNTVVTSQFGDRNSLDITQVGSYNHVEAYQEFQSHEGLISQTGDSNQAFLRQAQSPVGDLASIAQNGNGNVANVLQQ